MLSCIRSRKVESESLRSQVEDCDLLNETPIITARCGWNFSLSNGLLLKNLTITCWDHHVTVFTDNNPLSYLKTAKLGAVEQRWAAQLAIFDLDIKYRPGRLNAAADCLSRCPVRCLEAEDESEVVELLMIRAETTPVPLEINEKTNNLRDNHRTKCYRQCQ